MLKDLLWIPSLLSSLDIEVSGLIAKLDQFHAATTKSLLEDLAEESILLGMKSSQVTEIFRAAQMSPQSVLSPNAIPKDITFKIPEVSSSNILPRSHHTSEDTHPTASCTLPSTETSTLQVVQSQAQSDSVIDLKASELHCLRETFSTVITTESTILSLLILKIKVSIPQLLGISLSSPTMR